MTMENIALFRAIGAKMNYINQRQRVISQNIANSDTPGYKPKDLVKVDFGSVLKNVSRDRASLNVRLETTNNLHMPPPSQISDPKSRKQRETYEVAPAGNAVIVEEQLIHAGRNAMDYSMMLNIMQKQVGMLKTAIGRGN